MTKQDVLKMDKSQDIMKALANQPELWDADVSNHLRDTKRNENLERFGDADILHTPPKRKST